MNKEASKLYGEFIDYVNRLIPDKGDNRLECEYALRKLIKSIKQAERERCAKIVEKERESQGNAYIYFNNKLAKITKAIRDEKICPTCNGRGELSKPPYDDYEECPDCKPPKEK